MPSPVAAASKSTAAAATAPVSPPPACTIGLQWRRRWLLVGRAPPHLLLHALGISSSCVQTECRYCSTATGAPALLPPPGRASPSAPCPAGGAPATGSAAAAAGTWGNAAAAMSGDGMVVIRAVQKQWVPLQPQAQPPRRALLPLLLLLVLLVVCVAPPPPHCLGC
eukprot:TRINITY_DN27557_c0_g1_i1.p1 TRINITY_DN27557_c0_g1~~TRINITY_DN27557_c0_g1_i1.p1  ORF type:complete len:166 (-),score=24.12 TRINITY_DN27557_c0_g1_i1:298-795(-)